MLDEQTRPSHALPPPVTRGRREAFLFSYEIASTRREHLILECLNRWGLGALSRHHEGWLSPHQLPVLAVEVLDLLDATEDHLFACRVGRPSAKPLYQLFPGNYPSPLLGGQPATPIPRQLAEGWHLLAYVIGDPQRRQQVQQLSREVGVVLPGELFLATQGEESLSQLLAEVESLLRPDADNLLLYPLDGPEGVWMLSGPMPSLPSVAGEYPLLPAKRVRWWEWLGRRWWGEH